MVLPCTKNRNRIRFWRVRQGGLKKITKDHHPPKALLSDTDDDGVPQAFEINSVVECIATVSWMYFHISKVNSYSTLYIPFYDEDWKSVGTIYGVLMVNRGFKGVMMVHDWSEFSISGINSYSTLYIPLYGEDWKSVGTIHGVLMVDRGFKRMIMVHNWSEFSISDMSKMASWPATERWSPGITNLL